MFCSFLVPIMPNQIDTEYICVLTFVFVIGSPILWASFVIYLLVNVNGEPSSPGTYHLL